jgi:very-short-patch-repair endonuclease
MGAVDRHKALRGAGVWALAHRQHGVVTHGQLIELGFTPKAIRHRVDRRRLHRIHRGVFAVGTPQIDQHGRWMAAVLACGPDARLSHQSAAELWEICRLRYGPVEVSVPFADKHRARGVLVHRRRVLASNELRLRDRIPLTSPACTLVDLATRLSAAALERAVNEADKRDLIDAERLREAIETMKGRSGVADLRQLLDRRTFVLTDSELERWFLAIVRAVGLPLPNTGEMVNGFEVDFYWPDLGLVVETDGLRFHRTPAEQARDRIRDQTHTAAGLIPLRFTHSQIRFEREYVEETMRRVVARLRAAAED